MILRAPIVIARSRLPLDRRSRFPGPAASWVIAALYPSWKLTHSPLGHANFSVGVTRTRLARNVCKFRDCGGGGSSVGLRRRTVRIDLGRMPSALATVGMQPLARIQIDGRCSPKRWEFRHTALDYESSLALQWCTRREEFERCTSHRAHRRGRGSPAALASARRRARVHRQCGDMNQPADRESKPRGVSPLVRKAERANGS